MRRRLLQLLAAFSLLLAFATAGLWVRSMWRWDSVRHQTVVPTNIEGSAAVTRLTRLFSQNGRIQLRLGTEERSGWEPGKFLEPSDDAGWRYDSGRSVDTLQRMEYVLGFGLASDSGTFGRNVRWTDRGLQLPHWFLVLLFSLLPAVRVIRWQLRRRRVQELGPDARPCPACGYDLRATPDRCPECGHATDAAD